MSKDMIRTNKLNKTNKSGFTLVEMIVAITIVGILAAVTMLSIISWQDWSRFNQQNEYAQAIYVAAQNQLTAYSSSGYIKEFADSLIDPDALKDESITDYSDYYLVDTLDISGVTDSDGTTIAEGDVWKELDKSGEGKYGKKIAVLKVDLGEYTDSLELTDAIGDGDKLSKYWVYALLDSYISDKSVLKNGAVSIELSPADGQVYSVLYSDKTGSFKYGSESASEYNAKNRNETYRVQFMVGYFGVNTLTKSVEGPGDASALTLRNVILNNKELLYLTFSQNKNTVEVNNTNYDIYIYNSETKAAKPELRIALNFPDIINSMGGSYLDGAATAQSAKEVKLPVYRYYEEAGYETPSGVSEEYEEIGELPFLIWKTNNSTVNIALDAVDYQAGTWLYEKDYAAIHSAGYDASATEFDNTYSYFRFGLNNDNIKCGIVASAPTYSNSPVKYSNSENPVYYSEKQKRLGLIDTGYIKHTHLEGQNDYTYAIKNGRHLYNIRYTEDVDRTLTPSYVLNNESVTFELINDIDWRSFTGQRNIYASNLTDNPNDVTVMKIEEDGVAADYYFPSISVLRNNDTLKSRDGRDYAISKIAISEAANKAGRVSLNRTKDSVTGNYEFQKKPATALILQNEGSVKNLTLDEIKVEGGDYVAGFIGINTAAADREITNLVLKNTNDKTEIKGDANVGGIIAFAAPSDPDNTAVISNLTNRGKVKGHMAVGGIIGMVRNDYEYLEKPDAVRSEMWSYIRSHQGNLYIRVENCENYGLVQGATDVEGASEEEVITKAQADRYIGGIAGYCYNTTELTDETDKNRIIIAGCISTPIYKDGELPNSKEDFDRMLKGVYVGGVIGYNRYGAIENCSAKSSEGQGYVFGYRYVGGIVGLNIGPAKGTEIAGGIAGNSFNANNVFGNRYVGGVTGCNASIYEKLSDGHEAADTQLDPARIEARAAVDGVVPIMLPDEEKSIKVSVKNWTNTGVVIATDSYGGGITGFNAGWIYKCKSYVNADDAAKCLKRIPGSSYLGEYIGGIAGYNNGNIGFTDRDENGKKAGAADAALEGVTVYVTGKNFVGGIVGYNAEDAIVENYRVDGGYVHGSYDGSFIGGYAGFNESIDLLMDTEDKKPRQIYSSPNEITGKFFVGGNIGGNIINTNKKSLGDTAGKENIINAVFMTDNFLGKLEAKAFVGGFVGYNMFYSAENNADWVLADEDANKGATFVLTKKLRERVHSIAGDGELTEAIYQQELDLLDNLKDDKAGLGVDFDKSNCVLQISGLGDEDNWSTKTDLGLVSADIFVGGVLGYNDEDSILYMSSVQNGSNVLAAKAIERDVEQEYAVLDSEGNITDKKIRKKDYLGKDYTYIYSYAGGIIGKNSKNAIIDNCWNASNVSVDTKGTYTGGLCEINEGTIIHCGVSSFGNSVTDYIGGLCGLNKGSGLNKDITEIVQLTDRCNLHKDEAFGDKLERGINHCSFEKKTVSGRNVVGGIAAENFGTIRNIEIDGAKLLVDGDSKTREGVCGIYAGYNGEFGEIVLENDISNITIKSGGSNVGAVAGVNAGKLINQRFADADEKREKEPDADADIIKRNSFYNLVVEDTCKIEGYKNVGSVIGLNLDEKHNPVEHYTNKCAIIATHGNAGGIIGSNEAGSRIGYCLNDAIVAATEDGNAGGITAVNKGIIRECYDYKTVNAPKGMSGGMVAVNCKDAIIEDCIVRPEADSDNDEIEFVSTKAVGGIAAQNDGEINDNELAKVIVTNYTTTRGTRIGVIAGENLLHGVITLQDKLVVNDCQAIADTNDCKVGGIAGDNDGLIRGVLNQETKLPKTVIEPAIELGEAQYASLGGVAGSNTGKIENIAVDAKIYGDLGTETSGYGGIVGYNGYINEVKLKKGMSDHDGESYPAFIKNCTFDGIINAKGSSGAPARIGGIAGINSIGAEIEECCLGVLSDGSDAASDITYVAAGDYINKTDEDVAHTDALSYSNTGGIAGENYGFVSACDNKAKSVDNVYIIGFAGETGGIVGYNYPHAYVRGFVDKDDTVHYLTTGDKWVVDQRCVENDRGPGGIMGKCDSGEDICYINNYAKVQSMYPTNNKIGGIIGMMEQTYKSQTLFHHVNNYGEIKGYSMSGGFCGQIRGTGAVFKECINYGDVSYKYRFCGGFVGYHNSYANPLDFYSCINHGNIYAIGGEITKSDAGMGGFVGASFPVTYDIVSTLYDCVNTGNVINTTEYQYPTQGNTGSFVGYVSDTGKVNNIVSFELCRNYNTTDSLMNGFAANVASANIKNCLDVTNTKTTAPANTPFGGKLGTVYKSYYINEKQNDISAKDYGVYFTWHEGNSFDMKWQDSNYTDIKDPKLYLIMPDDDSRIKTNSKNPNIIFNLSYSKESKGIDSFVIYGWNEDGSTNRNYSYTAKFIDENDREGTVSGSFEGKAATADSKETIKVPDGLSNRIKSINIAFINNSNVNVSLRGFAYVPTEDTSVTAKCAFPAEKTGTEFYLGNAAKMNSGAAVNPSYTLPAGNVYKLRNDLLDINWDEYTKLQYSHDAGYKVSIPIKVTNNENSAGMDSFVFYVGNNNTSSATEDKEIRTYNYTYSVTMTDINGESATTSDKKAVGYDGSVEEWRTLGRCEVKLSDFPKQLDSKIASINLEIKADNYTFGTPVVTKTDNTVYLKGFAWVPKGGSEQKLAYGGDPEAKDLNTIFTDGKRPVKLLTDYTKNAAAPFVYVSYDNKSGFEMDANDPRSSTYYADHESYEDSKAAGTNSRINVYEDIDKKFIKFVQAQMAAEETGLSAPENLKLTKDAGSYRLTWDAVAGAAGYEVYYVLKDSQEEVKVTSETAGLGTVTKYNIAIDNSWVDNDYLITCYVRAIHPYHKLNSDKSDYQKYDSSLVPVTEALVKKPLPRPEAHIEVIAGNRAVIVLENYDEYAELGCEDSTINFTLGDYAYKYNAGEFGSQSNPIDYNITEKDKKVLCWADPNKSIENRFVKSLEYVNWGQGSTNSNLPAMNQYCSSTYFNGFAGDDINGISYRVNMNLNANTGDSYQTTDISAYDKAIGATVVYDHELTHTANSTGIGAVSFTSTLKNLPQEWFAPEAAAKITVRAYLYKSQANITYYGHDVCDVTETLNEDAKTEAEVRANQEILAGIYDDRYVAEDSDRPEANCIFDWSTNDLKPGYLLQRSEDGSYKVIYSSLIEMAMKAAADGATAGREYTGYSVASVIYSNMSAETVGQNVANNQDFAESYWTRGIDNSHIFKVNNFINTVYNSQDIQRVQEIMSEPVIEAFTIDETGSHIKYHIAWDKFYRDNACFNRTKNLYDSDSKLTNPPAGAFSTYDKYVKRLNQAGLDPVDNAAKRRLMNAYYYDYSNAKYRVELLGKTIEGEEVVIASRNVSEKTELPQMSDQKTAAGADTTYDVWDYECDFEDTNDNWTNYPEINVRVIRIGSDTSGSNNGAIKTDGTAKSTLRLPRYTESSQTRKIKLNTMSKPSVTITKDEETGEFVTTTLSYDVVFSGITDTNQLEDLGGYLIHVKVKESVEGVEPTPDHFYYVKDVRSQSYPGDTLAIDNTVLAEMAGSDKYVLSELLAGTDVFMDYEPDTHRAVLNLSEFTTGETVEFTVRALARRHAKIYKDGDEGIETEVVIPSRLNVPKNELLSLVTEDEAGMPDYSDALLSRGELMEEIPNTVSYSEYEHGFSFRYDKNDESYESEPTARIQMAAAVFDEKKEEGDTWDDGATEVLFTKDAPLELGNVTSEQVANIKLTDYEEYKGQWAGKYIKIALKAASTSRIDSKWTDENQDESTRYKWIHIPKLLLDGIELHDSTGTLDNSKIEPLVSYYHDGALYSTRQADSDETFEQVTIGFNVDANASGYRFTLKGTGILYQDGTVQTPVFEIYTEKNDEHGYETFITAIKDASLDADVRKEAEDGDTPVCRQNKDAVWVGTLDENETSIEFKNIAAVFTLSDLPFKGRIVYEPSAEGGVMKIVLPDLQKTDVGVNLKDYICTDAVLAETFCKKSENAAYVTDTASLWQREVIDNIPTGRNIISYMSLDTAEKWLETYVGIINRAVYDEDDVTSSGDEEIYEDGAIEEEDCEEELDENGEIRASEEAVLEEYAETTWIDEEPSENNENLMVYDDDETQKEDSNNNEQSDNSSKDESFNNDSSNSESSNNDSSDSEASKEEDSDDKPAKEESEEASSDSDDKEDRKKEDALNEQEKPAVKDEGSKEDEE